MLKLIKLRRHGESTFPDNSRIKNPFKCLHFARVSMLSALEAGL